MKTISAKLSLPEKDYTDPSLVFELLNRLEDLSLPINYSTMKNGKRGHFLSLSYLKNPYDSFYTAIEVEADSLTKALCGAIMQLPEDWSG